MHAERHVILAAIAALALAARPVRSATVSVAPGASVQDAIDAATPGDTIALAAGTYVEDIDFVGKGVTVLGLGPDTVLQGTGTDSVVRFTSGEGPDSILDSVVVTGGSAVRGGGIRIEGASPTVVRNVVYDNRAAAQGSGIWLFDSSATIRNNLVIYNQNGGGDPHGIEIQDGSPSIVNNTVVRNDSNGVILRGTTSADVRNNILAFNGSRGRGRGICDFSSNPARRVQYSLFHRNRKGAILRAGQNLRKITRAEARFPGPELENNLDGHPELQLRRAPSIGSRRLERLTLPELVDGMRPTPFGPRFTTVDAGDPDPAYDDLDGSRNDVGFTGGPHAPTW